MDQDGTNQDGMDQDGTNHDSQPHIKIFETSQVDIIPVIKSLLRSAGIPFHVEGEGMMNLYPSDLLGPIMGNTGGEVRFHVPEDRAEDARQLLTAPPIPVPELDDESDLA